MKKIIKVLLIVFTVVILLGAGGVFYLRRGLELGQKLTINDVNISTLEDGTYTGKYSSGRWSNEVVVKVKDHRIVDIQVVKDVLFPQDGLKEELMNRIIETQDVNVDVVAGATATSKAYLKAIEKALKQQ